MTNFYSKTANFSIFSGTKNNQIIEFSLTIVNKNPQKIAKIRPIFPGTKNQKHYFSWYKKSKTGKNLFFVP